MENNNKFKPGALVKVKPNFIVPKKTPLLDDVGVITSTLNSGLVSAKFETLPYPFFTDVSSLDFVKDEATTEKMMREKQENRDVMEEKERRQAMVTKPNRPALRILKPKIIQPLASYGGKKVTRRKLSSKKRSRKHRR